MNPTTPDGYAVVQSDGHFVGIWRDENIAIGIANRSASIKGESIRPMQFINTSPLQPERTPMNAPQLILPVALGAAFEDGYYGGRIIVDGRALDCILPPKAKSEHAPAVWHSKSDRIDGALSFNDSESNTLAMAAAGSKLAQWALDGGMVIPALDVLEQLYRIFKPSEHANSQWMRSGINLSAVPPTTPYTPQAPARTALEAFQLGGPEAFSLDAYWTSTQSADTTDWAWYQVFYYGIQGDYYKSSKLACRAVRMIPAI